MYLNHFKMTAYPFTEPAPLDRMLKDERINEGLVRLQYLSERGNIGLLTGPTGMGKSSLLALFIASLSRNRYRPLYLHLTNVKAQPLLRLIVTEMGEKPARGKEQLFLQILENTKKTKLISLLAIDEAQYLDSETLVDLRLLATSGLNQAPPIKILLSGQEPLVQLLKRSCHADLVNRITVRYRLHPLTREQSVSYIDHQIKTVGASDKIFEKESKSIIHDYAGGVPRQINNLANACLMNAASKNLQRIDEELVNATTSELQLP